MFAKDVISFDIGSENIDAVVGRTVRNEFIINNAISIDTPKNSFDDGRLLDIEALATKIRFYLVEMNIKAKDAIFTLNSSSIITREIILPAKKSDQLESMINFEISQYLPVDLSQYIIEYKYLEEFEEEGIKKSKVLVVAVQKVIVDGYFELTESLGFNPISMDVCSNSIAKLLHKPTVINEEPYSSLDTVAAIDIGHRSLNISIVNDGKLALSRMLTQGSFMIDQRIAESFDIELAEAEEIKQEAVNLSQDAELTPALEMLMESIHLTINDWIRDIDRVIKFYESRSNGKKVKQVLLYGGGANMKGIGEYFTKELHLPVGTIEMLNHIKWDKKLSGICIKHYMNAIGAISNNR